ncbi:MAG: hypothetical protein ACKO8I_03570, partial [Cyanobacteriota bacterium]
HAAHGLAVVAEHGLPLPLLALGCDGLGYGDTPEQPLWGGELLLLAASEDPSPRVGVQRLAALRPFPLIGGERASREPRRAAWACWWRRGRTGWPIPPPVHAARPLPPTSWCCCARPWPAVATLRPPAAWGA